MEIDTWYKWILVYFYDFGEVFLVAASIVLAWKYREPSTYIAAFAFCAFLVGGIVQQKAQRATVEAEQTLSDKGPYMRNYYMGRVAGSVGFLVGGGSLLWFAVNRKRKTSGKQTNS